MGMGNDIVSHHKLPMYYTSDTDDMVYECLSAECERHSVSVILESKPVGKIFIEIFVLKLHALNQ